MPSFCLLYLKKYVVRELITRLSLSLGSTAKQYALLEEKKVIAVAGKDRRIILSCPYTRRIPVVWRKDDKPVYSNRNTILSFGTLTIRPVSLAAEGLYECKSEDLFDHGYRAVFNVSINGNFVFKLII